MSLTFANKVTVGRILLVPFFIATVLSLSPERPYLRWVALGLFLTAVISDVIDGYIARMHHQKTKAGAILDPLADKMLLISAFTCLYIRRGNFEEIVFPLWFVVAIISRDIILLLGAMIIQLITGQLEIEANRSGKTTAFLQIVCILGMLLQWSFTRIFWYMALIATIISGVIYIKEGIKLINDNGSSSH
ncbi:MAG: CDP-alcohol phosphatidyltransferase family protein [Candidatus Omnitrophica bacterium]|nr:CDP-alcohol phosphatidyltransferase family protein [Candidatus Omnitrophota bacterium]